MKFLGFDPGALTRLEGHDALAEVTLNRDDDGRLLLAGETVDGVEFSVSLRPDFLDALVVARTREAAA